MSVSRSRSESRRSLSTANPTTAGWADWKSAWVIASAFCLLVLSTPGVQVVEPDEALQLAKEERLKLALLLDTVERIYLARG